MTYIVHKIEGGYYTGEGGATNPVFEGIKKAFPFESKDDAKAMIHYLEKYCQGEYAIIERNNKGSI